MLEIDDKYTNDPGPSFTCGSAYLVRSAAPITLVSNVVRHQFASALSSATSEMAPVENTRSSRPPSCATASTTTCSHCASSVTSHASATAVPATSLAASSH